MGLFEKMGREVEKFKQNAQQAAEEHKQETAGDGQDSGDGDDYEECPVCIERIPADATECPNCGTDLENYTEESVDLDDIDSSDEDVELPDEDDAGSE